MDAAEHDGAPGRERGEGQRHQGADRREDDRCLQFLGRPLVRGADPGGAEVARQVLGGVVRRAREGVDLAPLPAHHLGDDVRRRAEAVDAHAPRVAAHGERPVSDQAGAQQRRHVGVGEAVGEGEAEALVGDGVLRHAAVDVAAGEPRAGAQVLAPRGAVGAHAAGPAQPRHADPLGARSDGADDLVTQDARGRGDVNLAVHQVQVGAADGAGADLQQQLAGLGARHLPLDRPQR